MTNCVDVTIPMRWYAWRPVCTQDTGWVWFRWVWRERWFTVWGDEWWQYYARKAHARRGDE